MADVVAVTASYETWLGEHIALIAGDLDLKHREMGGDPMRFLDGTSALTAAANSGGGAGQPCFPPPKPSMRERL